MDTNHLDIDNDIAQPREPIQSHASDESTLNPVGEVDPQSGRRILENDGTPGLVDEPESRPKFSGPGIPPVIVPIYDVKMDGPDTRIREGYKNFLEYQAEPKWMNHLNASTVEDLEQAARDNVGYAFNEGYLKPLSNPTTPPAVKKQITDALLERAHGKVGTDVNVKLSGAVGVVTIGSEDIARLIEFANARAAGGDEAVVISE